MKVARHQTLGINGMQRDATDFFHPEWDTDGLFGKLSERLVELSALWDIYVEVFGTNQTRIDILNKAAPTFTATIHNNFLDSVILGICRLVDPPGDGSRQNITFRRLTDKIPADHKLVVSGDVDRLLNAAIESAKPLRVHRHKRIAHASLDEAVGVAVLPKVSRSDISNAITAGQNLMNALTLSECNGVTLFDAVSHNNDGIALVCYVQLGLLTLELQKQVKLGHISLEQAGQDIVAWKPSID